MAVVEWKELPERTYDSEISSGRLRIVRTRTFIVRTDAFTDDEDVARQAAGIPRLTEPHPSDPLIYCQHIAVAPLGNDPLVWNVRADYVLNVPYLGTPDDPIVSPLDRPAEMTYSFARSTEEVTETVDDPPQLIVTTAGELYDPPLQRETSRLVLTITKNFADFPLGMVLDYQDAINSDSWQGADPGTVKFAIDRAEKVYEAIQDQDFIYYRISMNFEFRPEGWQPTIVHAGYRYYETVGEETKLMTATDDNGVPLNQPVFLDQNGFKTDFDHAHKQTVRIYREREFALLGVP